MADVVDRADLVLDHVRGPVGRFAVGKKLVQRECPGPQDVGTGFVIVGLFHHDRRIMNDSSHDSFGKSVGKVCAFRRGKILLENMRHYINDARCSVIGRHGVSVNRVQHGELRSEGLMSERQFPFRFIVRDDRAPVGLGTGCGEGQDYSGRQRGLLKLRFAKVKIPRIAVVNRSRRHPFARVNDAAPACRQNKIQTVLPNDLNPFSYARDPRIRFYA